MKNVKLERFYNVGYGDYICSCCKQNTLEGKYFAVGEVEDIEGYEWRGFCSQCETKVSSLSNEQIYNSYNACECKY